MPQTKLQKSMRIRNAYWANLVPTNSEVEKFTEESEFFAKDPTIERIFCETGVDKYYSVGCYRKKTLSPSY